MSDASIPAELGVDEQLYDGPDEQDVDGRSGRPGDSSGAADDVAAMSYEQARDALIAVVDELERGGGTLERSLELWERGEELARRCESWLTGARARLDAARAGVE